MALIVAGTIIGVVLASDQGAVSSSTTRIAREEQVAEETKNRAAAEAALPGTIAADARKLARAGALQGPILGATCTSMARSTSDANIWRYNCIAIRRRRGRTLEGARFFATIDARTGRFTYGGD